MRRVCQLAVGWVAVAGMVWLLRATLGPWAAALVIGPVFLAGIIAGWAILERFLFEPPPLPVRREPVIDTKGRMTP